MNSIFSAGTLIEMFRVRGRSDWCMVQCVNIIAMSMDAQSSKESPELLAKPTTKKWHLYTLGPADVMTQTDTSSAGLTLGELQTLATHDVVKKHGIT